MRYSDEVWDQVKNDYEVFGLSFPLLAEKYGMHKRTISAKCKTDNWQQLEKQVVLIAKQSGVVDAIVMRKASEIMEQMGDLLSPLDIPLVLIFCENWKLLLQMQANIAKNGYTDVTSKGTTYLSADFLAKKQVEKTLGAMASQLGLSLASRKRMNVDISPKTTGSLFDQVGDITDVQIDI